MAFEEYSALVTKHRDHVFRFALYTLHHREDAEDVTQDVLSRLWDHISKLDQTRVGAWLTRVTRNACYDLTRKRRVRQAVHTPGDNEPALALVPDHKPDPESTADSAALRLRLEEALRDLDEPFRSVVVLREVEGLSYQEIADALDKPLNTIKVYLHRGRRKLRGVLAEEETYVQAS